LQSLKDTFADKLPGELEKVKKLRKYVPLPDNYLSMRLAQRFLTFTLPFTENTAPK
jgi:hypothetical protein